jgi:hypothetical protein
MNKEKWFLLAAILAFGSFVGLRKINAGTPQEQGAQLSGRFFHSAIAGSTTTTNGVPIQFSIAAPSQSTSGGQTISYQNCFTKFLVQISSLSVFQVYDGATTTVPVINLFGSGLGSGASNTISLPEDHLGPLCTSLNNATTIVISTGSSGSVTNQNQGVSWEGYTTAAPGSISN